MYAFFRALEHTAWIAAGALLGLAMAFLAGLAVLEGTLDGAGLMRFATALGTLGAAMGARGAHALARLFLAEPALPQGSLPGGGVRWARPANRRRAVPADGIHPPGHPRPAAIGPRS